MKSARIFMNSGFTIIELVLVLAIIAILSARLGSVVLNSNTSQQMGLIKQTEQLRRDIAHLQSLTLNTGAPFRLNIGRETQNVCTTTPTGTSCNQVPSLYKYWITCTRVIAATPCADTTSTVIDPVTGQEFKTVLDSGVSLTATDASSVTVSTIDFDSLGRPITGANLIASNPARSFTLSAASKTATVALLPITGFVEVRY
jgi:prepilin-type N-terminal cleavage/methylation domain-containing protein